MLLLLTQKYNFVIHNVNSDWDPNLYHNFFKKEKSKQS